MARLESSGGGNGAGGGGGSSSSTTSPLDDLCLKAVEEEEDLVVEERSRGRRRDNTCSPPSRIQRDSVDLVGIVGSGGSVVLGCGGRSSCGSVSASGMLEIMGGTHSVVSAGNNFVVNGGHHRTVVNGITNGHQRRIKVAKVVNAKDPEPHIYEDIEPNGPPKITPISGVLAKGKVVLRPIAFKPVVTNGGCANSNNNNHHHHNSSNGGGGTSSLTSGSRHQSLSSTPISGLTAFSSSSSSLVNGVNHHVNSHISNGSSGGRLMVVSRTGSTTSTLLAGGNDITFDSTGSNNYFSSDSPDNKSSSTVTLNSNNRYLSQTSLNGKNSINVSGGNGNYLLDVDARSACTNSTDSCIKLSETPASYFSLSNLSRGSVLHLDDDFNQTPSPSDSGVAELEAMLKEKDSEINYLRETMEQNEQVIFKVYEEKELSWQRENKRLKAHYEGKLRTCQQRALKMEQMLMMQTYQLQQEKRKLKQDCDKAKVEKEAVNSQSDELKTELETVRSQLEETEWAMCQKSGEISLLKSQLKDSQGDHTSRATELLHLRAQLKESRAESEEKTVEVASLRERVSSLCEELEDLRRHRSNAAEAKNRELLNDKDRLESNNDELKRQMNFVVSDLDEARAKILAQRERFELERVQWLEEKEKVIRYQKQLQLNYVQMYRRNRTLESEVEQLTLELEGRDLKLINGESEC